MKIVDRETEWWQQKQILGPIELATFKFPDPTDPIRSQFNHNQRSDRARFQKVGTGLDRPLMLMD